MSKSLKVWLVVGVVVVLGGAAALYWFVLRDTAPPEATLRDPAPTTAADGDGGSGDGAAVPDTPDGDWVVSVDDPEQVFVGYRVLELFGGDTIKKEAAGRTSLVEGSMTVDGSTVTAASFTADLTGLESDSSRRDGVVQGSVLDTATFPEATFELTEPVELGDVTQGSEVTASATGELTVHGVTQEVTFELTARWDGATISVAGSTPVVFADYEIEAPNTPAVAVDDEGTVELQLTFVPA